MSLPALLSTLPLAALFIDESWLSVRMLRLIVPPIEENAQLRAEGVCSK